MLELGNQFLCAGSKPYPDFPSHLIGMDANAPIIAKPYFESLGYEHVSIDLNGRNGTLVHDLSKPFDLGRQFDIVTDFGTSEHVSCLWACLRNVHVHTKAEGLIFHANPAPGNWSDHGYWYRNEAFYARFAELSGYALLETFRVACAGNFVDGWLTCALLRKTREEFVDKDAFYTLPLCDR